MGEAFLQDSKFAFAFHYFLGAAKKFHIESCFEAASLLEHGKGVKKDTRLALQFYKNSALGGYKPAMYRIAIGYLVTINDPYFNSKAR